MPTYEYECEGCQHNFDEFQSMTEEPLKTCPKCGQDRLRRLFGAGAAILFKGSGFYQTDYRSDSYKKAAKAESGDTAGTNGTKTSAGKDGSSDGGTAATASNSTANNSKSSS